MGTLAGAGDMATGDQRCEEAIRGAAAQEAGAGIAADHRVNIDELLALLDPSKPKASAHVVFIKAEFTPMVPATSEGVRATVDRAGYFAIAKALLDVSTNTRRPRRARVRVRARACVRACVLRACVRPCTNLHDLHAGAHRRGRLCARQ